MNGFDAVVNAVPPMVWVGCWLLLWLMPRHWRHGARVQPSAEWPPAFRDVNKPAPCDRQMLRWMDSGLRIFPLGAQKPAIVTEWIQEWHPWMGGLRYRVTSHITGRVLLELRLHGRGENARPRAKIEPGGGAVWVNPEVEIRLRDWRSYRFFLQTTDQKWRREL